MKLYTEEQVKETLSNMLLTTEQVETILKELTPIELPSDEEIETGMNKKLFLSDKHLHFNAGLKAGFKLGAEWMKEQIRNQNK